MKIRGIELNPYERQLDSTIEQINLRYESLKSQSDEELKQSFTDLRQIISDELSGLEETIDSEFSISKLWKDKETRLKEATQRVLDEHLVDVYAYVKLAVERTQKDKQDNPIILHDTQLKGGIEINNGKVAQLRTGEGKTLTATLPAILNALTGKGVHVITVNPHLAKRDMEDLKPTYNFLGLTVGLTQNQEGFKERYGSFSPEAWLIDKRQAYACDVTYGENSEFHFDYLRDMAISKTREERVQRSLNYAIIDEVDFVLEDEARTPHIMADQGDESDAIKNYIEEFLPTGEYKDVYFQVNEKAIRPMLEEQASLVQDLWQKIDSTDDIYEKARIAKILENVDPSSDRLSGLLTSRPDINKAKNRILLDSIQEDLERFYFTANKKRHSVSLTEKGEDFFEEKIDFTPYLTLGLSENDIQFSFEHAKRNLLEAHLLMEKGIDYDVEEQVLLGRPEGLKILLRNTDYTIADNGDIKIKDSLEPIEEKSLSGLHNAVNGLSGVYVNAGKITLKNEQGRRTPGRKYQDGLHQALEVKEGVMISEVSRTQGAITTQDFYKLYKKLSGMTATPEESEFIEAYNLETAHIPTDRPYIRRSEPIRLYQKKDNKLEHVIDRIIEMHKQGRPVLVSAGSDEESETIAKMLKQRLMAEYFTNTQHLDDLLDKNLINKLNQTTVAKDGEAEANIMKKFAGKQYAITISTRMVGRGTDIKVEESAIDKIGYASIKEDNEETKYLMEKYSLSFQELKAEADRQLAIYKKHGSNTDNFQVQLGGLHVIGTYLPELRRYQEQLAGRPGRQGDIGSFEMVLSKEEVADSSFTNAMISLSSDEEGYISNSKKGIFGVMENSIIKAIQKTQNSNAAQNAETRKKAAEYGEITKKQSEERYKLREKVIGGNNDDLTEILNTSIKDTCSDLIEKYQARIPERWNWEELEKEFSSTFNINLKYNTFDPQKPVLEIGLASIDVNSNTNEELKEEILKTVSHITKKALESYQPDKKDLLEIIDENHIMHEELLQSYRRFAFFQSYAGKDPLVEFKRDAGMMYDNLVAGIKKDITKYTTDHLKESLNSIQVENQPQSLEQQTELPLEETEQPSIEESVSYKTTLKNTTKSTALSTSAAITTALVASAAGLSGVVQDLGALASFMVADSYIQKKTNKTENIIASAFSGITALALAYLTSEGSTQDLLVPAFYVGLKSVYDYFKK